MWETFITSSLWLREAVWNTALAAITRTITMWKCCQSRRLLKLAERETEETDTGWTSQPSVNCSQSGEAGRWSSRWESHHTLLLRTKQHCKGRTSGQTPRLYLGTSTTSPVVCTHLYQIWFAKYISVHQQWWLHCSRLLTSNWFTGPKFLCEMEASPAVEVIPEEVKS